MTQTRGFPCCPGQASGMTLHVIAKSSLHTNIAVKYSVAELVDVRSHQHDGRNIHLSGAHRLMTAWSNVPPSVPCLRMVCSVQGSEKSEQTNLSLAS